MLSTCSEVIQGRQRGGNLLDHDQPNKAHRKNTECGYLGHMIVATAVRLDWVRLFLVEAFVIVEVKLQLISER